MTNKIENIKPKAKKQLGQKKEINDQLKSIKEALDSIQSERKFVENSLERLHQHNKIVSSLKEIVDQADYSYWIQPYVHKAFLFA